MPGGVSNSIDPFKLGANLGCRSCLKDKQAGSMGPAGSDLHDVFVGLTAQLK